MAGATGVQGATLVGPTGPVGDTGSAGSQGMSGQSGARGSVMEGGIGGSGSSGAPGMQGPTGPMGPQGPTGIVNSWTAYRDFTFDRGQTEIQPAGRATAANIASYLAHNPSLQVGIDGTMIDARNQSLTDGRVHSVRVALEQAGVPGYRIKEGAFNDPQFSHDGRVEVLISTR
jgi:hypothetical protein